MLENPVLKNRERAVQGEVHTLSLTQAADLQEILPKDENETFTCSQQLSDANLDQMTWSGIKNKHNHHESMAVQVNCLKRNVKHSNMYVII